MDPDLDAEKENQSPMLKWLYSDEMYIGMKSMAKLGVIMVYFFLADRYVMKFFYLFIIYLFIP